MKQTVIVDLGGVLNRLQRPPVGERRVARRALVALVALLAACEPDGGSPCNELCDLEARCSDKLHAGADRPRFDSGECAAACKALERDGEGKKLVGKHRACVEAAGDDCAAVLACP